MPSLVTTFEFFEPFTFWAKLTAANIYYDGTWTGTAAIEDGTEYCELWNTNNTYNTISPPGKLVDPLSCRSLKSKVPSGSIIDGIVIKIKRRLDYQDPFYSALDVYDEKIEFRLYDPYSSYSSNLADSSVYWTKDFETITYGSPTEMWGMNLKDYDINSSDFRLVIWPWVYNKSAVSGGIDRLQIDYVEITVYYSEPSYPVADDYPNIFFDDSSTPGDDYVNNLYSGTTYYVSTLGSDSNNGLSVTSPWSTFIKVLSSSGISSGDRVFVRPGTYIQTSFTAQLASPTIETPIIGDTFGRIFGVKGQVILSGYSSGINTSANSLLDISGKSFLTFRNIYFNGGANLITLSHLSTSCKFIKCTFTAYNNNSSQGIGLNVALTSANNLNLLVDSCIFDARIFGINISAPRAVNEYDIGVKIQNSLFIRAAFRTQISGSGNSYGGISIVNNTIDARFFNGPIVLANPATSIPIVFVNNLISNSGNSSGHVAISISTTVGLITNFNRFAFYTGTSILASLQYAHGNFDVLGGDSGIHYMFDIQNQTPNIAYGLPVNTSIYGVIAKGTSATISGATIPTHDILGNLRPITPTIGCLEFMPNIYTFYGPNGFVDSKRGWNLLSPNSPATSTITSTGFVNSKRGWREIRG